MFEVLISVKDEYIFQCVSCYWAKNLKQNKTQKPTT